MKVTTVGLDLAKNVFSLHGVDERSMPVLKKTVRRAKLLECFAQLPPCVVGMEACSGAHFLGRALRKQGHDVLMDRSGNRYLAMAVGSLLYHARRLETLCFGHLGTSQESVEEHERIIDAIRAGDARTAGTLNRANWLSSFHRAFGTEVALGARSTADWISRACKKMDSSGSEGSVIGTAPRHTNLCPTCRSAR